MVHSVSPTIETYIASILPGNFESGNGGNVRLEVGVEVC